MKKTNIYPRTVYVLTTGGHVQKKVVVRASLGGGAYTKSNDLLLTFYESPADAIKKGRANVTRRLAALARDQAAIGNYIDALNKAEKGPAKRPAPAAPKKGGAA